MTALSSSNLCQEIKTFVHSANSLHIAHLSIRNTRRTHTGAEILLSENIITTRFSGTFKSAGRRSRMDRSKSTHGAQLFLMEL